MSSIKPILFNTDMVKAILDGRKTVTRRLIKSPYYIDNEDVCRKSGMAMHNGINATDRTPFPNTPYLIGEILYVRETWKCWRAHRYEATADIKYKAGGEGKRLYFSNGSTDNANRDDYDAFIKKWLKYGDVWEPSIHMPKEAARIFLRVTNVSVAKLQDIDARGIRAEGLSSMAVHCGDIEIAKQEFAILWDSTITKDAMKKYSWEANPWVWVIEFEREEHKNEQ